MNILSLHDTILIQAIKYLGLKDLLSLGDSHTKLREIVYKSPEIWTSDLLFPIGDKSITDKFIQRIIPRITRHYGILELRMIDLPLTWFGYLLIFDQFAHSVNRIEIKATMEELNKLSHHLSIFAGNLAMLQQNNKIPITFRQYAFDDEEEYSTALADSNYMGQRTLHNLNDQFAYLKLDDPPFERLNDFHIVVASTSDNNSTANNAGGSSSNETSDNIMRQLELLASFLSGCPINAGSQQNNHSHVTPRSPIPTANYSTNNNKKRSRGLDDSPSSLPLSYGSPSNKYTRYDNHNNNSNQTYYQRHQQQQYSGQHPHHHYHHHHHQEQQQQEQQEPQHPAKQQRLPSYSSSFA